ncbi:MAG: orotate phosphoribosyltransferase, partial [Desulfobacterales bacterium]|nr:orotate phosphoribosyltransferase [Desulfobacterales bacterium]
NPIEAFSIRKEPKAHGMRLQIEGNIESGDSVIIVDDVVTTGKSTMQAIDIARKHGINILCAIILVDRCEENGRQNIESKGIKVYSIFTVHDF